MYRVTWIENDGTVSLVKTTCSEYLAREWQKCGKISVEVGMLKDCTLEKVDYDNGLSD